MDAARTAKAADPVEGGSRSQAIAERVRADVLAGRLKPGTKLWLEDLRTEFGVSWSPLREALSRLVAEGIVVPEAPRGYSVAPVSREHFLDLVRTRAHLEGIALRESIARGDDAWEAELLAAHHRLAKFEARPWHDGDFEQWETFHRRFHDVLIGACGSPLLLQFCTMLQDMRVRYRRVFLVDGKPATEISTDHAAILEAALARDADRCCALMTQHIERSANAILSAIDQA